MSQRRVVEDELVALRWAEHRAGRLVEWPLALTEAWLGRRYEEALATVQRLRRSLEAAP